MLFSVHSVLFALTFSSGVFAATSFILAGDSTTANATSLNSGGWGNGFCASLEKGVPCINRAQNGATTGTFVDGGYWALVLKDIKEQVAAKRETWVTIQFGHNDQKIAPPESMGTNITSFVRQIRQLGAQPILITSLSRRSFTNGGKISDTLGPWADETIRVAAAEKTHLLDLHKYSIQYLESIGPDAAYRLNKSPTDYTHLNTNGTIVFGRMVADLAVRDFQPTLLPILSDPKLSTPIWLGQPIF